MKVPRLPTGIDGAMPSSRDACAYRVRFPSSLVLRAHRFRIEDEERGGERQLRGVPFSSFDILISSFDQGRHIHKRRIFPRTTTPAFHGNPQITSISCLS